MDIVSEDEICPICALSMDDKYTYCTKECGHKFHYECLLKTFRYYGNNCPYCRKKHIKMPMVNGLKTGDLKTCRQYFEGSYPSNITNYKATKCNYTLKRGKNKGELCNKNCKLGYDFCGSHC